ncbi:hypothetical protein CPT03_17805 [Pedobacter ginsengisoli]|uniref:Uncharacterized protein n=1 Tax=Pedobacter ginsengisoli TaxID=363852 RepID=A0A2D1U9A8_9SPHI|nr:hypothetical protein CPT03_17805 [Pedobacter ginsengisoli]
MYKLTHVPGYNILHLRVCTPHLSGGLTLEFLEKVGGLTNVNTMFIQSLYNAHAITKCINFGLKFYYYHSFEVKISLLLLIK